MCISRLPQGCCGGYFDYFFSGVPYADPFQRFATMLPLTGPPYPSQPKGWSIAHIVPVGGSDNDAITGFIGYTRDGAIVWTSIFQSFLRSNATFLEVFNAKTQQALFYKTAAQLNRGNNVWGGPSAIGDGKAAWVGGLIDNTSRGPISVLDTAGAVDDWGAVSAYVPETNQFTLGLPIDAGDNGSYVSALAQQDWPWAACILKTGLATNTAAICKIDRPNSSGGKLHVTDIQSVASDRKWFAFDKFGDNWGGFLTYNTGFGGNQTVHWQLNIDGNIIWQERNYGSLPVAPNLHVCYPHETLGAGYVAVAEYNGNDANLVIYKNGAQVWKSPNLFLAPTIYGSTDRWIYFSTQMFSVQTMTGGKFTTNVGPDANQWLVKHDGSEIMPAGSILDTKFVIRPWESNASTLGMSRARDSSLPLSLPATYDEMYANRHSV